MPTQERPRGFSIDLPVEILHADAVRPEPGERVFRHGFLGPMVLWIFLVAPLAVAFALRAEVLRVVRELPWPVWLVLGPVVLIGGLLWLLCLHAAAQVVQRTLAGTNWMMRVSSAGLVLNLRSFQNAHFPHDGPTVARFAWPEIARVREARDATPTRGRETPHLRTRWLQLELALADTDALARAVAHERERPGPERAFLGIRGRGRFGHVPVFVAEPGVVRTDWLGRRMLRALAAHVQVAEPFVFDRERASSGDLDAQVRALLTRGDRMAAHELLRRERRLSLGEARDHVERLARESA